MFNKDTKEIVTTLNVYFLSDCADACLFYNRAKLMKVIHTHVIWFNTKNIWDKKIQEKFCKLNELTDNNVSLIQFSIAADKLGCDEYLKVMTMTLNNPHLIDAHIDYEHEN